MDCTATVAIETDMSASTAIASGQIQDTLVASMLFTCPTLKLDGQDRRSSDVTLICQFMASKGFVRDHLLHKKVTTGENKVN